MVAFSLLGSFGIKVDGSPLVSGLPRRCVSLVGYILLRRQERVYRERLAAALWPDVGDAEARGKLRRHLYLVGQAIPRSRSENWFAFDATTVGWNPAVAATTDVELLQAAARLEQWSEAVGHYRGELLAECDDEWLIDERERFRDAHVTNLERLAAHERSTGCNAAAVAAAQELLRLEPWREVAVRVLMETRHAMGDRAGALAEYERFSQRLRDDLDVEPMPETTALYRDLVQRVVHVPLQASPEAPCAPAVAAAPFVGREAQLETLRETWSRALQKRGSLAFVGGESGIGKSRLVEELATCVIADGGAVLRGGTTYIETSPYQALVEALRSSQKLANEAEPTRWRAPLRTILPELSSGNDGAPASLGPEAERSRLFEAVVAAFQALAASQPLLVILEDLHWAGSGTIALLAHVARRIGRDRISVVATHREDDLPRGHPLRDLRRQLAREGTASIVSLGALTPREVERFFTLRFGDAAEVTISSRYYAATDGLPLFLVELLKDVDGYDLLPSVLPSALPQTLAVTIERRLASLSEAALAALELAAVIGAGFDLELIAEATGWTEAETTRHVGDLIEKHLVRELPGSGAAYAFAHAFYREDAYARIPAVKRRQRHARVARALAELYPERLGELAPELARHYEEAGDGPKAVGHLVVSAARASEIFANEDALAYAARAIALQPCVKDELGLRLLREEAHRRLGVREGQRAELEQAQALALADSLPDRDTLFEILQRRIALAHAIGDRTAERLEIERAERLAEPSAPAWAAKLALARGKHHLRVSAHRDARESLERAARGFETLGDARGVFESYITLAELERIAEDHPAVEARFLRAERELAAFHDSRALVMRLYEERANFALVARRFLEVDAWANRFLETADATGDVAGRARAFRQLGSAAAWRLDVVAARTHLGRAAELFEALQDRYQVYAVGFEFGMLAVWLGHIDEALIRFERAMQAAQELQYTFGLAACFISLSHARSLACDFAGAEANAHRAIELARSVGADSLLAPALNNLGIALVGRGLSLEAETPLLESARLAERTGRSDIGADAQAYLALMYAMRNEAPAALAAARKAQRLMDDIPHALRSGNHYWVIARALRRVGDLAGATLASGEGHQLVMKQLDSIPDEESRRAFAALPAHRAILGFEAERSNSDVFRTVYA